MFATPDPSISLKPTRPHAQAYSTAAAGRGLFKPFHTRFHHRSPADCSCGDKSELPDKLVRSADDNAVSSTIEPRTSTFGATTALAATTACPTMALRPTRDSFHRIDSCTTASLAISQFSPITAGPITTASANTFVPAPMYAGPITRACGCT